MYMYFGGIWHPSWLKVDIFGEHSERMKCTMLRPLHLTCSFSLQIVFRLCGGMLRMRHLACGFLDFA